MALVIGKWLRQTGLIKINLLLVSGIIIVMAAPFTRAFPVQAPSLHSQLATANMLDSNNITKTTTEMAKGAELVNPADMQKTIPGAVPSQDCKSVTPIRSGMAQSSLSHLQKLSEYEQVCQSGVVDKASFFATLPTSTDNAVASANDIARILKEYARFNIQPLVFLEPTNDAGLVSLSELRKGTYDSALQIYFSQLKSSGITDVMMGTWVPLPEGNLPVWSSVDPADFSAGVTKIAKLQKQFFFGSKTSVLLDTKTYPTTGSWDGGQAVSLIPYVQNIPKGLLDSIGLQGFPWEPAANLGQSNNGTPKNYLRVDLLIDAARSAAVNDVWVNTGTFSTAYSGQASQQVTVPPAQRLVLLSGVITQLHAVQAAGLSVSMHLFAEDKSRVSERINWSYWQNGQYQTSDSTTVFKSFVHELHASHVPLWVFDAAE